MDAAPGAAARRAGCAPAASRGWSAGSSAGGARPRPACSSCACRRSCRTARYRVWVGGGTELNRLDAARAPARYRPTSLDDAWRRFAALRRGTTLHAVVLAEAAAVTTGGRDYPDLPPSADALLSSGLTAAEEDRRSGGSFVGEVALPLAGVVRGELLLNLTVDSKAP